MTDNTFFRSPKKKGKIGVLLSGRGSNFLAIHRAVQRGQINADISLVLSNKKDPSGIIRAQEFNLDTVFLNPKQFETREAFDEAAAAEIDKRRIDLICLAGYMRILTPGFCRKFQNRIMNIHPALLPAFPGLHVQKKALEWGVKYSGATVHFVVPDVDMGPIILQAVVPVYQEDTEETLSRRILAEEHRIYPEAVQHYFEGRLEIRGRRVFILD
ncbi:MAG: phosphoribosylglycinamide formyltransferase [Candidatus Aminicenantes bacterium]